MARLKSKLTKEEQNPQSTIIPERVRKIVDVYSNNNIEYTWSEEDKNEQLLEFRRKLRPDTHKYIINRIDRVRDPTNRKKEYYFYQADNKALNQNDVTERSGNLTYGFFIEIVTELQWNDQQRIKQPVELRKDPIYLYDWNPKEVRKLLDGSDIPCLNFYIGTADRKGQPQMGINDVKAIHNQDDFINGTFDDLVIANKLNIGDENTSALPVIQQARQDLEKKEIDRVRQLASSPKLS
jgi:hypothetical protein